MNAIVHESNKYSPHISVLLNEVVESLQINVGKEYLDCTFGAGGYSSAILEKGGTVTALDQDQYVKGFALALSEKYGERFSFVHTNFSEAYAKLSGTQFDGIALDLGVSSMQLDQAERGFSFLKEGPLDMRMGKDGISAADFIQNASEQEIADVIYKYGEEVQSRAIAKSIVSCRQQSSIDTTTKLAEIVRNAKHFKGEKIDPATKTFQAIRIYINDELGSLERFLNQASMLLKPKGILAIVTFHSLEDSIVKNYFKNHAAKKVARSKYSTTEEILEPGVWLKIITKKPIVPSREEVKNNIRSRSAKLRVAQKIGGEYVS